jgi:hypothetical protein
MDEAELKKHMDYETYSSFINDKRKGQRFGPTEQENAYITRVLAGYGIDFGDNAKEKDRKATAQFHSSLQTSIAAFVEKNNRNPSEFERREIISNLVSETDLYISDVGVVWDTYADEAPLYMATTPDNIQNVADNLDIPATELAAGIAALEGTGQDISKSNLKNLRRKAEGMDMSVGEYTRVIGLLLEGGYEVNDETIRWAYKLGNQ